MTRSLRLPGHSSRCLGAGLGLVLCLLGLSACGISRPTAGPGQIVAVGAENEYANVIAQVGGRWVKTVAIMSNPNTDPHEFEASPSVAATVAAARLIVQNGVGYDDFMTKVENASPDAGRRVIDVQKLLGLADSTPNPHLWYAPATMPRVAEAIGEALSALQPAHAGYFRSRVAAFEATLTPWKRALADFRAAHPGAPAATTEPVADYMLQAAGVDDRTPFSLQADIMNGTDPAPQAIALQDRLFTQRRVKVFLYNQQVTDSVTDGFLSLARANHVPVVGVYETMPPHESYGSWMLAETNALSAAISHGRSTTHLP